MGQLTFWLSNWWYNFLHKGSSCNALKSYVFLFSHFFTFSRENDVITMALKFKTKTEGTLIIVVGRAEDLKTVKIMKIPQRCSEIWPFKNVKSAHFVTKNSIFVNFK